MKFYISTDASFEGLRALLMAALTLEDGAEVSFSCDETLEKALIEKDFDRLFEVSIKEVKTE